VCSSDLVKEGEESIFTQGIFESITPKITGLNYESLASAGEQHLQLYSYVSVFTGIGLITLVVGIIGIVLSPLIKKKMGVVH
ncbi:MAG: MFS transporter, partial [Crocinitomicaceae bacterium]